MAVDVDTAGRLKQPESPPDETDPDVEASMQDHDSPAPVDERGKSDRAAQFTKRAWSNRRLALTAAVIIVGLLGGLVGWLGYRAHQIHQVEQRRQLLVLVARQGALNLTTLSYTEIDADLARILNSATGTFHDEFQQRSKPFAEVIKQARSTSQGTVAEAGIETEQGDQASVLVAVSVKTATANNPEEIKAWRMRINLQQVGNDIKVSNVEFVP
jgi:Mce-associated membrane protein